MLIYIMLINTKTNTNINNYKKHAKKPINKNLTSLNASQLRKLILNIDITLAEILYSNGINGELIYNYNDINNILMNYDKNYENEIKYHEFIHLLEQQYQV